MSIGGGKDLSIVRRRQGFEYSPSSLDSDVMANAGEESGNMIRRSGYRNGQMIESNPGNSLVLGNYARFLKEVRGDLVKAGEYCERAILACPGDGDVLSLYADLVWQTSKDAQRAERYFDQAVQAAPQDCYVMTSYARFLWDADDEEEEKEEKESKFSPSTLFQGFEATQYIDGLQHKA